MKAVSESTRVALVGGFDGAHIGGSLARAADTLGVEVAKFDGARAWGGGRWVRAVRWRLADRRPGGLRRFGEHVVRVCVDRRIGTLIATGAAPLGEGSLRRLGEAGVVCINYSTDDPWNPFSISQWFLKALPAYGIIATTRRANIDDLLSLGCRDVRYLPFGYDEAVHALCDSDGRHFSWDVLFVGGADADRMAYVAPLISSGLSLALVGADWDRFEAARPYWLGCKSPSEIREITASAKVSLCLVRRANRDGHVMRSIESAAIGTCMLVEDTAEHRDIFGPDGERVLYFKAAEQAVVLARELVSNPISRRRLASAARARVIGAYSYRDRLRTMLDWAGEYRDDSGVRDTRNAANEWSRLQ